MTSSFFQTHQTIFRVIAQRQRCSAVNALSYSAKGPSQSSLTWERAARRVKNTESETNNAYLDLIRDTHDPSMHMKTIEEELQGSIGKALGRQGQKILLYVRLMNQEYERYTKLQQKLASMEKNDQQQATIQTDIYKTALAFNQHRKQAIQARWELMVHRQAAGFIVNNHQHVVEHYPIAEALSTDDDEEKARQNNDMKQNDERRKGKKQFGDQLDWWQRVGRWK